MTSRVGIDTGGTFTDLVALQDGTLEVAKTLSTPTEPARSMRDALRKGGIGGNSGIGSLVHGTTVATNALIERRGAVVGLITTAGFGDILQIQRITRPRSFDLDWVKPSHLVPRYLVREVPERIRANGSESVPLDEAAVRAAALQLIDHGVEAVAVAFLFSFLNGEHERRARDVILEECPGLAVSVSSEVFAQWREYERTSTCVVDAFLKPIVARYAGELAELKSSEQIGELFVMRSNGGAMTPQGAREQPVSMVRSGPAGGVIASVYVAELTGIPNLIVADMGGTSFDTGLILDCAPALTTQAEVEWGIPIAVPMVDVRSVGAGGGSIAHLDSAGILHVGPESAGADPGPACYGRGGTLPTVTDANLVVGRLPKDLALAGDLALDPAAASKALDDLAVRMKRTREDVALGILRIADNNMAQAIRLVTIDRGYDPRDFSLIAFGGAGPLHASSLARALSIRQVVVPVFPGAFSAFGALISDTRFDYMKTFINRGSPRDIERIVDIFDELEAQARRDLRREGLEVEPSLKRSVEMRYAGQNWELDIALDGEPGEQSIAAAKHRFHSEHAKQFGWNEPDGGLELVNFKLAVIASRDRPDLPVIDEGPLPEPLSRLPVLFESGSQPIETPVFWRDTLNAYNEIHGPALVAEVDSTILVAPNEVARVDRYGNLIVAIAEGAPQ